MSPVVGIQRRMRELGRIRTGDQVPDKNGKARAHMLETFRLTSADRQILALAAQAYGGEVRPWVGGPSEGLFELYTERSAIPIAVPPSEEPYSQWMELWSAGGCQRRCDTVTVLVPTEQGMRERKCLCDPDQRECALTTRVSVMLPDVPVLGVWRLESRGEYAARELPGVMALIASASRTGVILPGELRIEKRSVKKAQEKFPRRFVVPVIDLQVPLRDLLPGGALTAGELPARPTERPALPSGTTLPEEPSFRDPDPPAEDADWGEAPPLPAGDEAKPGPPEVRERPITEPQRKRLWAIAGRRGASEDDVHRLVASVRADGGESTSDLNRTDYDVVCRRLQEWTPPAAPAPNAARRDPDDPPAAADDADQMTIGGAA